ncbi:MAG: hypothetical protein LBE35_03880 [Clostridiales bacterium]|nr:hypothetical protein [Clostridiales bacterium]
MSIKRPAELNITPIVSTIAIVILCIIAIGTIIHIRSYRPLSGTYELFLGAGGYGWFKVFDGDMVRAYRRSEFEAPGHIEFFSTGHLIHRVGREVYTFSNEDTQSLITITRFGDRIAVARSDWYDSFPENTTRIDWFYWQSNSTESPTRSYMRYRQNLSN